MALPQADEEEDFFEDDVDNSDDETLDWAPPDDRAAELLSEARRLFARQPATEAAARGVAKRAFERGLDAAGLTCTLRGAVALLPRGEGRCRQHVFSNCGFRIAPFIIMILATVLEDQPQPQQPPQQPTPLAGAAAVGAAAQGAAAAGSGAEPLPPGLLLPPELEAKMVSRAMRESVHKRCFEACVSRQGGYTFGELRADGPKVESVVDGILADVGITPRCGPRLSCNSCATGSSP